jgi:hypothetical protein
MQLTQIVYTSQIAASISRNTASIADALRDVHRSSQRNNARCDVSGILLFSRSHFLQVLEGRRSTLKRVYAKIVLDPRHEQIELLCETPIQERCFADWHMGLLNLDDWSLLDTTLLGTFAQLIVHARECGRHAESRVLTAQLMRAFKEQLASKATASV